MKKFISLILILVTVLCSCQSAGIAEPQPVKASDPPKRENEWDTQGMPEDIAKIIEKGNIVFGFIENDRPPFYMNDGQGGIYGIDVELALNIAQELGVEAVFDRSSETYTELFQKIIDGEVDIVAAKFSRSLGRALYISYTEPYAEFGRAIMTNKTNEIALGIEDDPILYLRSNPVKIAAVKGTSFVNYAYEMFPAAQIVEFDTIEEGAEAVLRSEVDAFLYDELEFARLVGAKSDILLYASVYVIDDIREYICMAVPNSSPNLCAWLNTYIENKNLFYTLNDMVKSYQEIFSS